MIKKVLIRLLGVIFGFLLVFVGFELYLKQTGCFELQRFSQNYGMNLIDGYKISKYPGLAWEKNPLSPPINAYGRFVDPKDIKKDKEIYRIIAIGDSVTEQGYYEKFLEEMLNDSHLDYKFEVWNCGVGGYYMPQYHYYLKYKGIKFQADMIIIGFCIGSLRNHEVILKTKNGYVHFKNPFTYLDIPLNRYLFLHSRVYRFLIYNLEKTLKVERTAEQAPRLAFDDLINLAQSKNIKILVLIWPYLKNKYTDHELDDYNKIKTLLKNTNIPYIDLHKSFENRDLLNLRVHPQDYIHPSQEAFRIMTSDIYSFIMDNFDFKRN